MVWARMCLFQLDESMCPCQESFTFPIFPQLLYPALALYLLIIFISWMCWFQLCHLPHFCICLPTSLSDIIQTRSGWEKTHNLESLVRYNSKIRAYVVRKMIDSWLVMTWSVLQEFCHCFQWDQDWAFGCSEKWTWAMWFSIQTFPKLRSVYIWRPLDENMQCLFVRAQELILNIPCRQSPGFSTPQQRDCDHL